MTPKVELTESSRRWRASPGIGKVIRRAIKAGLQASGARIFEGAEVSVLLADDLEIRALNERWRGLAKSTNVLSFPAAAPDRIAAAPLLGDIAMAFETVEREAFEEGKTFGDHVAHLAVHGFLHLLGFDHQSAGEADRMEALEADALARLGIANPYASRVVADAEA
jgi:probable rRNA maturation factor